MANRASRRAAKKQDAKKPQWKKEKPQEVAARLVKNGITLKDLQANWDKGFAAGYKAAAMPVVKSIYAGACLVLREQHGFGAKRCQKFLKALDQRLLEMLNADEAIEDVFNDMHLKLNFNEPFDRIEGIDD